MLLESISNRENCVFLYEESLIVIRHQISRITAPGAQKSEYLCDPDKFDFSRRGAARHSASHPMPMNETFRCGVSGFREMILEFEFFDNIGEV